MSTHIARMCDTHSNTTHANNVNKIHLDGVCPSKNPLYV